MQIRKYSLGKGEKSQIIGVKASASDGHCSNNCCLDSVVKISPVKGMKTKKKKTLVKEIEGKKENTLCIEGFFPWVYVNYCWPH